MPFDAVAWIVAVEKYSGAELDIAQPVGVWALEFAELMIRQGIGNIVLSTSLNPNGRYDARLLELQKKGVQLTGAEMADIQNALVAIRGKGTLFFYWVGHGIMAPSRQLLCADSRKSSDLRVISADSLLKRLRSPEYPRVQMGFFDCCAQVVMSAPATLDLGGDGKSPTRQFFYHAASAGETATGSTEKAGFSSTVLQSLGSAVFPLDPATFFDALKASLGNIPLQTRPFLQRTDESGDVWSSGDPSKPNDIFDAAIVAELAQSQFDCLWQPVRAAGVRPVEVARAYRKETLPAFIAELRTGQPQSAAPDLLERAADRLQLQRIVEPMCLRLRLLFRDWLSLYARVANEDLIGGPERVEDLPRLLLSVLDQARKESGLRSLIKLLELATRRARKQEPEAADALCHALANHPQLRELYPSVIAEMPAVHERLYLLLAIDWDPNTQTAFLVKAWISPGISGRFDAREFSAEGKLAEQINFTVQNAMEEYPERPIQVELLLPNELLCTPRELLELVDPDLETCTWLEAQLPITLRWHNRMKGNERCFPGSWKAAGLAARSVAEQAESLSCAWRPVPPDMGGNGNFVGLTYPGPCPSDPRLNKQEFFGELLKGEPYMCWPRNKLQDLELFKNATAKLFRKSQLKTLSVALRDGRSEPSLKDLVVLIDEPHRNPYDDLNHLTEMGQRGN